MNVYEKLSKVQCGLKAPKSQYNSFGGYYYRNCEDIQEAAKQLLCEIGALLVLTDDLISIGDRYYIKATASFIDCETGEKIENTAYAREEISKKGMDSSQITGATSSYARKYALNGLFCIDDSKDSDSEENNNLTKAALISEFKSEIKRTGKSLAYFLKNSGVERIEDMGNDYLSSSVEALSKLPNKGE